MPQTLDLLKKALEIKNAARWQHDLNLSSGAIYTARKRGRLSPTLAGQLAIALKEDPMQWTAIAALEAEPDSPLLQSLKQTLQSVYYVKCLIDKHKPSFSSTPLARIMRACSFWRP